MKLILLILLLFTTSCGSLPDDPAPAPIDIGLHQAEMHSSCGFDVGLLGCHYSTKTKLENKWFKIPHSYNGHYEIESDRCLFKRERTFKKTGWAKFTWSEMLQNKPSSETSCIFQVSIKIDRVRRMVGQFALVDMEEFPPGTFEIMGRKFTGVAWYQIMAGSNPKIEIKPKSGSGELLEWLGCGRDDSIRNEVLTLGKLVGGDPINRDHSCIYEMAVSEPNPVQFTTFNLKIYQDTAVRIPDPAIEWNGKWLRISSQKPVGIIAIDDKWRKGQKLSKIIKKDQTVFVRLITEQGRYKLLQIKDGKVIWNSSIY